MKTSILLLFIVGIIGLLSCANENLNKAVIEKATHFDENKSAELEISKTNPVLIEARAFHTSRDYEKAIAKFDELDLKYDTRNMFLSEKADCYLRLKNFNKAIEMNTIAINLNPMNTSVFSNRGLTYVRAKNYDLALLDFNQSIKLDSLEPALYYNRCSAYIGLGDTGNVCRDLNRAIDLGFTEKYGPGASHKYNSFCN